MVVVAIAGGTRGIGLVLVKAILDTGKHTVVVLSRTKQIQVENCGVVNRIVDYTVVEQVAKALQDVHTVISCISTYGSDSVTAQLTLLEAAKKAGASRFVPSDWATDCYDAIDTYAGKERIWQATKSSGLEYTRFTNGIWMNVWGPGAVRDETEALSGYEGPPFAIDLKAGTAIVPGDGSQKVVFTMMQDVGLFVAASLDLSNWEPESRIVGDKLSFGELIQIIKRVTGRELQVTQISTEESLHVLRGESDFGTKFFHQLLIAIARNRMDFNSTLNDRLHIKPITAEEYFRRYWTLE